MHALAHRLSARGTYPQRASLARREVRFLGTSLVVSVALFVLGLETAAIPNLSLVGIFVLLCGVESAFLLPFLWKIVLQYL